MGRVVILHIPAEKLNETNQVIEQSPSGGYRTELYAAYDYKPIGSAISHRRR